MSDDRPTPLEVIVRAVAGGAHDDDDQRASTFARGLALGALVGAAIAGSTIWQRRHAGHQPTPESESRRRRSPDGDATVE
jgi:hypothetical protein